MISRNVVLLAGLLEASISFGFAAQRLPEPGPEAGGLRLRLQVAPEGEGHEVRVDLLNVSGKPIALKLQSLGAGRPPGGVAVDREVFFNVVKDKMGVESDPAVAPYVGQNGIGSGVSLLTYAHTFDAGGSFAFRWKTAGRRFKPGDFFLTHNPEFIEDGLYSIRVSLTIEADGQSVLLRSNEQLVSFGGSREVPKSNHGSLAWVNEKENTAGLNLGTHQKIAKGDRFLIRSGTIGRTWTLTLTNVTPQRSSGWLKYSRESATPFFPKPGRKATLIRKK